MTNVKIDFHEMVTDLLWATQEENWESKIMELNYEQREVLLESAESFKSDKEDELNEIQDKLNDEYYEDEHADLDLEEDDVLGDIELLDSLINEIEETL